MDQSLVGLTSPSRFSLLKEMNIDKQNRNGSWKEPRPAPRPSPLTEGRDYYMDKQGRLVMTARYLLERGYCCENGCRHCPYDQP